MCWTVDMIMQMKRPQMILGSPLQGITVAAWVLKRSVAVSLEVVIFVFNLDYAKLMFHAWSCPMLNYLKKKSFDLLVWLFYVAAQATTMESPSLYVR